MYQEPPSICPVCFNNSENKIFVEDFDSGAAKFTLFECPICNVQFWFPLKHPGSSWYEENKNYKIDSPTRNTKLSKHHRIFLKEFFAKQSGRKLKLLDVGCNTGEFLLSIKKRGWEAWGIDINRYAIDFAKNRLGLDNVYNEPLEVFAVRKDVPQFDVITFFEVFEHLDNHRQFLKNIDNLLADSGYLFFSVPNRQRALAKNIEGDYPPHHLARFSALSIKKLFSLIFGQKFHWQSFRYIIPFKRDIDGALFDKKGGYLRFLSINLVGKIMAHQHQKRASKDGSASENRKSKTLIGFVKFVAEAKKIVIGFPLLAIFWLIQMFRPQSRSGLLIVFKKTQHN